MLCSTCSGNYSLSLMNLASDWLKSESSPIEEVKTRTATYGWQLECFQPLSSEKMASFVDLWEGQHYLWDPADKDLINECMAQPWCPLPNLGCEWTTGCMCHVWACVMCEHVLCEHVSCVSMCHVWACVMCEHVCHVWACVVCEHVSCVSMYTRVSLYSLHNKVWAEACISWISQFRNEIWLIELSAPCSVT